MSYKPVGAVAVLIFLAVLIALSLWFSALVVGAVGAVFLQSPFWHGYHRAWQRWGWLVVFWMFAFGGGSASSRRKS